MLKSDFNSLKRTLKTEQRKDKREIGVYDNRLEKSCTLENRVIKNTTIHFLLRTKEDHINVERRQKVKLRRAQGECLGTGSRRRTWLTAKSLGEL